MQGGEVASSAGISPKLIVVEVQILQGGEVAEFCWDLPSQLIVPRGIALAGR